LFTGLLQTILAGLNKESPAFSDTGGTGNGSRLVGGGSKACATSAMNGKSSSDAIARQAKSNLAFALASLPRERRQDMISFYAFCRIVDDIADDPRMPVSEKEGLLGDWKRGLRDGFVDPGPQQREVEGLIGKYSIPAEHFQEIIRGVEMDLTPRRYGTADELELYCHRVASVVGLISIEIFGYRNPDCREYARRLGLAMQWTNILRDVGEDARNGRLYLPEADLYRYQITDAEIFGGTRDGRFLALMHHAYARAMEHYRRAEELLPAEDRRTMVAGEVMRKIYKGILIKMKKDGFRVFDKRYRLARHRMGWILLSTRVMGR